MSMSGGSGGRSAGQAVIDTLAAHRLVPVIRFGDTDAARNAIAAVAEAGFGTVEITMTVPGAAALVAEVAERAQLRVGAGTVLDREQAAVAIAAGARFLVSPCLVEGVAELCSENEVACIIGAFTPSEVRRAAELGADAVKVFPAASAGGPAYLRALRSVFPTVPLIPTGGIGIEGVHDYLAAGAICVGIGGNLFGGHEPTAGQRQQAVDAARRFLQRLQPVAP